jgi:5-methylcytosine-specific restriction endonuclease McrA
MKSPNEAVSETLHDRLITLSRRRGQVKDANRRPRLHRLTAAERADILSKTGARCHICGGDIRGPWNADHVMAHGAGGKHSVDNYLPAHSTCNNYRWDYLPEEFELILKLGVWARTQVEKGTIVGQIIEQRFSAYEATRISRRKSTIKRDGV